MVISTFSGCTDRPSRPSRPRRNVTFSAPADREKVRHRPIQTAVPAITTPQSATPSCCDVIHYHLILSFFSPPLKVYDTLKKFFPLFITDPTWAHLLQIFPSPLWNPPIPPHHHSWRLEVELLLKMTRFWLKQIELLSFGKGNVCTSKYFGTSGVRKNSDRFGKTDVRAVKDFSKFEWRRNDNDWWPFKLGDTICEKYWMLSYQYTQKVLSPLAQGEARVFASLLRVEVGQFAHLATFKKFPSQKRGVWELGQAAEARGGEEKPDFICNSVADIPELVKKLNEKGKVGRRWWLNVKRINLIVMKRISSRTLILKRRKLWWKTGFQL
jgi:hypothetical protein